MQYILVYTTLPKRRKARSILKTLLKERLVACGNIIKIDSGYWWEGEVVEDREYVLILKTRKELYEKLEKKILELHPYEVPMIVAWEIDKGFEGYLRWVDKETDEGREIHGEGKGGD
ncbi:divalent-cation tolerance protein CutA [bacterium]|nr:MAG: divalent-cation tolerance protein CutA [bacterium]